MTPSNPMVNYQGGGTAEKYEILIEEAEKSILEKNKPSVNSQEIYDLMMALPIATPHDMVLPRDNEKLIRIYRDYMKEMPNQKPYQNNHVVESMWESDIKEVYGS
jgi:hypothetical protein